MAEFDENSLRGALGSLGGGTPLRGLPAPQYSIINTGNPEIDMMLSQFLIKQVGIGKFLPQQMPAQNLLDQMASAKYMSAMRSSNLAMREKDNDTLYRRLLEARNKIEATPATELQKIQLQNTAGMINNDYTRPFISALVGPQAMEDFFFGQKGSREMLGQAIGGIGFSRPDSVLGGQRMNERSLKVFTEQLYNNLYGPDADINDISGFSAGRVGTIATELSRRGLLPESMRQLTADERRKVFTANAAELERLSKTPRKDDPSKMLLSPDALKAIRDNSPLDEIAALEGGSDAVRRVDANRVASTLKDYSKAIATVREIFGDNGISNAPMSQVMAAMSALTQNSLGNMDSARLSEVMRKTQMVARDAGISLEGLMGLSARSGALAEVNGLPREFAQDNAILAMERLRALQNTGGFKPGFGRMDPDKAVLAMVDENTRADASHVGRFVAIAQTALDQGLIDDKKGARLKNMLATIREGRTLMYDEATGQQIDVYDELGRNPEEFLRPMFQEAGLSDDLVRTLNSDPNTLEALKNLQGRQFYRMQAGEVKKRIGFDLENRGDIGRTLEESGVIPKDALPKLNADLSAAIASSVIEDANTQMSARERIDTVQSAMLDVFTQRVISEGRASSLDEAREIAKTEMLDVFGNEVNMRQFISSRYAEVGAHVKTNYNQTLPEMQQKMNRKPMNAAADQHLANISRVKMFDALRGPESTLLQRISDTIMTEGGGNAIEKMLGVVDRADVVAKIKAGLKDGAEQDVNNAFVDLVQQRNNLYVDTQPEIDALVGDVASSALGFDELRSLAKDTSAAAAIDKATSYMTTEDVAGNIKSKIGPGGRLQELQRKTEAGETLSPAEDEEKKQLVQMQLAAATKYKDLHGKDAKFDITNPAHVAELAALRDVDETLKLGLGPTVMTEGRLRSAITDASNAGVPLTSNRFSEFDRERMERQQNAFRNYTTGLQTGNASAADILEMRGIKAGGEDDKAKTALAKFLDTGDTAHLEEVKTVLGAKLAGDADKDSKIAQVVASGQFARVIKSLGGLESIGVSNATQANTAEARIKAVKEAAAVLGKSDKADSISKILEKSESPTGLQSDEERETYRRYFLGSEDEFKAALTEDAKRSVKADGTGTISETVEDVAKKVKEIEAKTKPPELAGLGGALSGVGSNIAAAIKDAFSGEVKIQTASIERVEFKSSPRTIDAADPRPVAASLKATADGEIRGTVRIAGDLRSMFVQIARSVIEGTEMPNGIDGAPTRVT